MGTFSVPTIAMFGGLVVDLGFSIATDSLDYAMKKKVNEYQSLFSTYLDLLTKTNNLIDDYKTAHDQIQVCLPLLAVLDKVTSMSDKSNTDKIDKYNLIVGIVKKVINGLQVVVLSFMMYRRWRQNRNIQQGGHIKLDEMVEGVPVDQIDEVQQEQFMSKFDKITTLFTVIGTIVNVATSIGSLVQMGNKIEEINAEINTLNKNIDALKKSYTDITVNIDDLSKVCVEIGTLFKVDLTRDNTLLERSHALSKFFGENSTLMQDCNTFVKDSYSNMIFKWGLKTGVNSDVISKFVEKGYLTVEDKENDWTKKKYKVYSFAKNDDYHTDYINNGSTYIVDTSVTINSYTTFEKSYKDAKLWDLITVPDKKKWLIESVSDVVRSGVTTIDFENNFTPRNEKPNDIPVDD